MRAETVQRAIATRPGTTIDLVVDVVNSGDLIDGVTTRLIGLPGAVVRSEPAMLPLFPGANGQIRVIADLPTSQPAGRHPVTIEVVSAVSGTPTQYVDLEVTVAAVPGVRVSREQALVRARRSGRFVLAVENTGNIALDTTLTATSPDRVTTTFAPATVRVEPGAVQAVLVRVAGPRMITGAEVDRPVTVTVAATPASTSADPTETAQDAVAVQAADDLTSTTPLTLKQRPLVSRGFLTFLILASIVALWAAIFLLGLTQVFKGDPLTKTAPVSFYPDATAPSAGPSGSAAGALSDADPAADTTPPGATPKTGLLAPGVGGEIDGTVTAASNATPIGRITVTAWRMGRNGPVSVSSAATQADGTYALAGLFPTTYWLEFSADGYRTAWYPGKPSRAATTAVAPAAGRVGDADTVRLTAASGLTVGAQSTTTGTDVVLRGDPARISGRIDPGDASAPPITQVTATMIDANKKATGPVHTATTDASGAYRLTGLKAPGTYQLAFSAPGYQVTTQLETVVGGEDRREPTILLGSREGTLTGTVYDGQRGAGHELGGVTVSTTVSGSPVTIITPTVGTVGTYTFDHLPTPGTYLVTFTAPGHGSTVRIVDLPAGGDARADTVMTAGTGSISGHLVDASGHGIGGATVTVGGVAATDPTATAPSTTTISSGDVGAFSVTGLTAPGDYTLTFSLPGSSSVTIPVTLKADAPAQQVTATLNDDLVRLYGRTSTPSGGSLPGATVTVTDGVRTWTTTSTGAGGSLPESIRGSGGYLFPAVAPGIYGVTITAPGYGQQTTRLHLTADRRLDLAVVAGVG